MKIVRKDYNKPNRCPSWSGAGMSQYSWESKVLGEDLCHGGSSGYYADGMRIGYTLAGWNFHRCDECDVLTLPYVLRWVDPDYWWGVKFKFGWRCQMFLRHNKFGKMIRKVFVKNA